IKDIVGKGVLTELTRLVLANAIYFKGDWALKFKVESTREAPFLLSGDGKANVPMMNQTATFKYAENDLLQVLELPYVSEELAMDILLPRNPDGLGELEAKLTADALAGWLSGLRAAEVVVAIPKFTMTRDFNLSGVLGKMGMPSAFTGEADFSGMNGKEHDLFISAVLHKAFVEVNEEGTEAAAATVVVVRATSVRERLTFRADHPFVFLIRDLRSGSILFMGRVVNP
ncbi:MAG: serpin family protein, partial [Planctomycetota bacterium]|nr:serpin family protein [Planctomycetota bacterium]